MKQINQLITWLIKSGVMLLILGAVFSCDKDDKDIIIDEQTGNDSTITEPIFKVKPSINFIEGDNYISNDASLFEGEIVMLGIHAEYNGYDSLIKFTAKKNGIDSIDISINKHVFNKDIQIKKGIEDLENWEFIISDSEGLDSSIFISFTKKQQIVYGEINEFLNVELGAQNNSSFGSFFSTINGSVHDLESAYNNQSIIDLLYFYDDFDKMEENTMASPGASFEGVFGGEYGVNNWTDKITTRFSREKIDISINEFDKASDDSLLLKHTFTYSTGGRRFKNLKVGDIVSFVRDEKAGMFKVLNIADNNSGSIVVDIKIQK